MEASGFFKGVNLSAVKKGRYLNKAGTFFTLAKLIYNNKNYEFNSLSKGAVIMTSDVLGWTFIAPDGRFDMDTLAEMTVAEMLQTMASVCEETPVDAWEDFNTWLSEPDNVDNVNNVLSGCTRATVSGVDITIPTFTATESFPAFLRWLTSFMGEASALPASVFRNPNDTNRFDLAVDIYQQDGTEEQVIGYNLVTPSARPETEELVIFRDGDKGIYYNNNNGVLSLPALGVMPSMCPTFDANYNGYNWIMYLYEPTSDNLGLGITLPAGWYAVNMDTFAITPFDLEANPISIMLADVSDSAYVDPYIDSIISEITGIPEKFFATMVFSFKI